MELQHGRRYRWTVEAHPGIAEEESAVMGSYAGSVWVRWPDPDSDWTEVVSVELEEAIDGHDRIGLRSDLVVEVHPL
ncbi:MAG TPA: hypothetical protein VMS74_08585 [Acidimicrobiia bacterium]|nr:hypothetical protein [Acidimicrobiia bacterium]